MDTDRLNHVTEKIIGAAYEVANVLGSGFVEKVYENALFKELRSRGLEVRQQVPLEVRYKGELVGEYVGDLVVDGTVLVELKVVKELDEIHMAQCLNYLKASGLPVCLLINFHSPRVFVKRIINT